MHVNVLNKDQTHAFIEYKCLNDDKNFKSIEHELASASSWENMLNIISYFIAIVIERKKKDGKDVKHIIDELYELNNDMFMQLLPIEGDFIDFMLRHVNPETDNLENALIKINQRWLEYDYSRTVRL